MLIICLQEYIRIAMTADAEALSPILRLRKADVGSYLHLYKY